MDDWLVSVVKDKKVIDLYFSDGLRDIATIRALHKDCEIETMLLRKNSQPDNNDDDNKFVRWQSRPVRCIETGEVFSSAAACAMALGVGRCNVYKAIQRGLAVRGNHYEYKKYKE